MHVADQRPFRSGFALVPWKPIALCEMSRAIPQLLRSHHLELVNTEMETIGFSFYKPEAIPVRGDHRRSGEPNECGCALIYMVVSAGSRAREEKTLSTLGEPPLFWSPAIYNFFPEPLSHLTARASDLKCRTASSTCTAPT